jgi:hypothetical protein
MDDHAARGSMVKVWWWNQGGPQCTEVPFEMVDEVREDLRDQGVYYTWVTGSIPVYVRR